MPKIILHSQFFESQKHVLNYIRYLAKQGDLFSGLQEIPLSDALKMMQKYYNTVCWRHVYSLKEEDVKRLEIDRDYMKALIESQKNEIAKALHISPENLILYASYHNVAHHPHLHFVMRSKTTSEGFVVKKKGEKLEDAFKFSREKIKSSLANQIFREDLLHIKVKKADTKQSLNEQTKLFLNTHFISKEIFEHLFQLEQDLSVIQGKKFYGYLPANIKQQVDEILKLIVETDSDINTLFKQYRTTQRNLIDTYADNEETIAEKLSAWESSFFHPKKGQDTSRHNIIVRYALNFSSRENYKEIQRYKKEMYRHKTRQAAARSMLYHIGQSLQEDTRRLSGVQYYSPLSKPKHMAKKIQKEIIVDQVKSIEVGGKL